MMTYMMKNYKSKVKLLLNTKFSIFSSVNTKFHDYFCPVFSSLIIIVHFTLDKSCLEIYLVMHYLLYSCLHWELTDCALGRVGCGEGVVFHVCGECVVCCERRVCRVFYFLEFVFL